MSLINKVENLEEKIYKIIRTNVNKIRKGYEVIDYEINDKNIYACSKIICYNGFKGSIWDIEKPLTEDLEQYKKSIKRNGFLINDIYFYIDTDKINLDDFNIYDIEVILLNKNNT